MNENAKQWVEALRSGEYEQVQGRLRRASDRPEDTAYCCLGVACDLFIQAGEGGAWEGDEFVLDIGDDDDAAVREKSTLPEAVREWLELSKDTGGFKADESLDGLTSLLVLNDERQATFEQIAAVIESEPEGLFA